VASGLDQRTAEAAQRLQVPGVAVGVIFEGQEHVFTHGVTSVDNPLPVTADTLFQIGSITKTFTATAAMRLVAGGQLRLDAPVREYVPDLSLADPESAARVTVRELLQHTGGWSGDFFVDTGLGEDALTRFVARLGELDVLAAPGEVFSYNNAAFSLAGRVIEVVTGKPVEEAIRELVLQPLGLSNTFFDPDEVMTRRFAVGHIVYPDRVGVTRPWRLPRNANAAGGLISTVRDQLAYARFQMGSGEEEVISADIRRLMQTPAVDAGPGGWIGIAWMVRDVGGVRVVSHGGATNGQLSAFEMVPERKFAVTVLTNADRGAELHREVVRWALEAYLGVVEDEPQTLDLSKERRAEYLGTYRTMLSTFEVTDEDGELAVRPVKVDVPAAFRSAESPPPPLPPAAQIRLVSPDGFVVARGPTRGATGFFRRDPSGHVVWMNFGGRLARRVS